MSASISVADLNCGLFVSGYDKDLCASRMPEERLAISQSECNRLH
jgi:hypothetical protein